MYLGLFDKANFNLELIFAKKLKKEVVIRIYLIINE